MKAFLVGLWSAFIDRVFVNLKPTLIGIGIGVAAFAFEFAGSYFAAAPEGWAKYVAMIAVPVGAWLRSRANKYPQPTPVE